MRFLLALVVGAFVCVPGAVAVEAFEAGPAGALLVLLAAGFAASLADRERFYGIEPHR